jgi:hypothetical protein
VGVFANVTKPRGLLHLPDLDPPPVAVCSAGEDNAVKFFTLDGAEVDTVVHNETHVPLDLAVHPDDPGAIVVVFEQTEEDSTTTTEVWSECIPSADCSSSGLRASGFGRVLGIATSAKLGAALLIDDHDEDLKIVKCAETCSPFIACPPTRTSWTPTAILVDDERELVLVGDSENLEVHASVPAPPRAPPLSPLTPSPCRYDFEGNLVHSIETPLATTSLAFKPGLFAPLIDVSLSTASLTTTSPIIFSATSFFNRLGRELPPSVDFSNFAIKATGDVSSSESNVVITKTISGSVSQADGGEVRFAADVPTAGEWTFSLVDEFNDE